MENTDAYTILEMLKESVHCAFPGEEIKPLAESLPEEIKNKFLEYYGQSENLKRLRAKISGLIINKRQVDADTRQALSEYIPMVEALRQETISTLEKYLGITQAIPERKKIESRMTLEDSLSQLEEEFVDFQKNVDSEFEKYKTRIKELKEAYTAQNSRQ